MSCKPLIYMSNEAVTQVAQNAVIPFGNIVRRKSNHINGGANGVTLGECGYYEVLVNITFTGQAAGDAIFNILQDNVQVIGGSAQETITTASTEYRTVTIPVVVRVERNSIPDVLSVVNAGIAINVVKSSIVVIKE